MKIPTLAAGAFLLAAAALNTGCHSTVNSVEAEKPKAETASPDDPKPEISQKQLKHVRTDGRLTKEIQPISLLEGIADDGVSLKVQLRVRNGRRGPVKVNYKVEWFDKNGLAISGYTPVLQSIHLLGRETKPIVVIAPTPKALDYRFEFIRFVE
jgi:uncharacterized protein YcfL